MQRLPGRSQRRVLDWIDQTNASCLGDDPADAPECMVRIDPPPNDSQGAIPVPTRQRRHAMNPKTRRPSSQGGRNLSVPRSRPERPSSTQTSSTIQHLRSNSEFRGVTLSSHESDDTGQKTGSVYSALLVLVCSFLCAALVPSLFVLGLFSVFLTFAPSWSSIQTAQFLPLHREASIISLGTDEEAPDPKERGRNVFDVAFERNADS